MFLTKAKIALAVAFAVGLFAAGVGALAHQGPGRATRGNEAGSPSAVRRGREATSAGCSEGRRRGARARARPDGKPVTGAKLVFVYPSAEKPPEKVWAVSTRRRALPVLGRQEH